MFIKSIKVQFSLICIAFLNNYICNMFLFEAVVFASATAVATASNFNLSSISIVGDKNSNKMF